MRFFDKDKQLLLLFLHLFKNFITPRVKIAGLKTKVKKQLAGMALYSPVWWGRKDALERFCVITSLVYHGRCKQDHFIFPNQ